MPNNEGDQEQAEGAGSDTFCVLAVVQLDNNTTVMHLYVLSPLPPSLPPPFFSLRVVRYVVSLFFFFFTDSKFVAVT